MLQSSLKECRCLSAALLLLSTIIDGVAGALDKCNGTSWDVAGISVWKWAGVQGCLAEYKMTLHDMVLTLENLYFGESDIYAFSEISKDAQASKEENRCGLKIHDVQVDLRADLEKVYEDMVLPAARDSGIEDAEGAEELAQVMSNEVEVSAFEFHCRLRDIFSPLNDGHTMYYFVSYVFFGLPVDFAIGKDASGELVLTAASAVQSAKMLHLQGNSKLLSSSTPKRVLKINGGDPLEYVQRLADAAGVYSDAGSRLNSLLLKGAQMGGFPDGLWSVIGFDNGFPSSAEGEVTFTFEDGDEIVDAISVILDSEFEKSMHQVSPDYTSFTIMELRRDAVEQERSRDCQNIAGCRGPAHANPALGASGPLASATGPWASVFPSSVSTSSFAANRAYERLLPGRPVGLLRDAAKLAASRAVDADARQPRRDGMPAGAWAQDYKHLRTYVVDKLQKGAVAPVSMPALGRPQSASEPAPGAGERSSNSGATAGLFGPDMQSCLGKAELPHSEKAHIVYQGSSSKELATVTRLTGGHDAGAPTMILKLTSMGEKFQDLGEALKAWQEAVKDAKNHNVRRIIFDIISNGGGLIALSDILQGLVLKDFDAATLCNWYNKYVSEYWRQWILSFGQGLDASVEMHIRKLEELAAQHPIDVVRWYGRWELKDLVVILETSNEVLGRAFGCSSILASEQCTQVLVDTQEIVQLQEAVEVAESKEELLNLMRTMLRGKSFIPKVLFGETSSGAIEGTVTNVSGWFPFLGTEILDPITQGPFEPPMSGLTNVDSQEWGGTNSNYSKRGLFETCPYFTGSMEMMKALKEQGLIPGDLDLAILRDHPFEDIAIVTDGLAGSAASAFPSRLMMSGKVTLFSYGGRNEAMDTSSFAGGNVLEYDRWWPRVAFAAELGMWLLPDTPWERMSRQVHRHGPHGPDAEERGGSPVYPRPMPTTAAARFNFNIMYVKELSAEDDGQSLLPRQFYRLPAHKHYDRWPRGLEATCTNTKELYSLYRTIRKENWCEVRTHPQYEGAGWATGCIPEAESCKCCDIDQSPFDAGDGECETGSLGVLCMFSCDEKVGPVACEDAMCTCQEGTCARDGMCVDLEKEGNLCPAKNTEHGCFWFWQHCPEHSVCTTGKTCRCTEGYCAVDGKCVRVSHIGGSLAEAEAEAEEVRGEDISWSLSSPWSLALFPLAALLALVAQGLFRMRLANSQAALGREPLLQAARPQ